MKGKLFPGSTSIYDDEAKVIYDYFSKAADKIISEEDRVNVILDTVKSNIKEQKKKNTIRFVVSFLFFVALLIMAFYALIKGEIESTNGIAILICLLVSIVFLVGFSLNGKSSIKKLEERKATYEKEFSNIKRDYNIAKLGTAYVPVAERIPFDDKSLTVDYSGSVPNEVFDLKILNDTKAFEEDVNSFIEVLENIPKVDSVASDVLDTSDYSSSIQEVPKSGFTHAVTESLDKISADINNVKDFHVSLPVISPDSQNMEFIQECGVLNPEEYPVIDVFDVSDIKPKVDIFYDIYKERKNNSTTGNEKAIASFVELIGKKFQSFFSDKMFSCTAVLQYNDNIFANVLKSPYRNYSPKLEAENLQTIREMSFDFNDMKESYRPFKLKESSLLKFDLYSNSWIDETGAHFSVPFSISQIQQEIFMPIVSSLMDENSEERLAIYERINSQKLDYLNKWHTETQDFYGRNRDTSDQLKSEILKSLSEYNTAYASWRSMKDTIDRMDGQQAIDMRDGEVRQVEGLKSQVLTEASLLNQNFEKIREEFDEYMERLQDDIDEKAGDFGHVKFFEAFLYAEEAKKMVDSIDALSSMDDEHKDIARISPYLAKYGTIPPKPSVDSEIYNILTQKLDGGDDTNSIANSDDTEKADESLNDCPAEIELEDTEDKDSLGDDDEE